MVVSCLKVALLILEQGEIAMSSVILIPRADLTAPQRGDVVELLEDEGDIEMIPAGTRITLKNQNGDSLWYGEGVVNGVSRILLVKIKNMRLVERRS